jgi:hypothetical protein
MRLKLLALTAAASISALIALPHEASAQRFGGGFRDGGFGAGSEEAFAVPPLGAFAAAMAEELATARRRSVPAGESEVAYVLAGGTDPAGGTAVTVDGVIPAGVGAQRGLPPGWLSQRLPTTVTGTVIRTTMTITTATIAI